MVVFCYHIKALFKEGAKMSDLKRKDDRGRVLKEGESQLYGRGKPGGL